MQLKQIHTADTVHFSFVEKLLTESFPANEYRPLENFKFYTDHIPPFHNNIIFEKEKLIGLITYWDFSGFCYIEHFAIDKSLRGRGYGAYSLFLLKKLLNVPLVLEVELPINDIGRRRIQFYLRQGFKTRNNYYTQPPYRPTDRSCPMLLMSYGDLEKVADFKEVRRVIYQNVYGVQAD
jgi:GNAT superfamily N-acetyltransferase